MDSFRKAYGALKDSTKVGLAKVNSDFKDLDIAIVKATNHVECPPKERHVRKIFAAVSVHRPRADVAYCIHALSRRLAKTRNWIVAVKTLIVIHRTLREGDPSFREELIHYSQRGQLFPVSNFKDDSTTLAWDCSGWVRSYALFLEERLECFRALNYDIETDRVTKSVRGVTKAPSKTRVLNGDELLDQLPALQQLLFRLVGCQPEGAACHNFLIQFALALILKESFKIYCAINDGIINLVDTFFEMPKSEAVRALDIYKKAGRQAEHLADFYGFCRTLDLARTFHFPILKQAPASFLATMEEYIKEAPETKSTKNKKLEDQETEDEPQKPEERPPEETKKQVEEVKIKGEIVNLIDDEPKSKTKEEAPPPVPAAQPVDLLSLDDVVPNQPALQDNNALALAIVEPANNPPATQSAFTDFGTATGWELALVTTPSNTDQPQVAQNKMAGGFNKLLLDSLYEDNAARQALQLQSAGHHTSYGYETPVQNPFDSRQDPFAMSNNALPQSNMQMGLMSQHDQMAMMQYQRQMMMQYQQQQQMMMPHQQQNMMMMAPHYPYTAQYSQQQMPQMGAPASNPFADSFNYSQNAMPPYGNQRLM